MPVLLERLRPRGLRASRDTPCIQKRGDPVCAGASAARHLRLAGPVLCTF